MARCVIKSWDIEGVYMRSWLASARVRTLCLSVAVVVNVAWSYCVMHLGRYGMDPSLDPVLNVALPCYAGYIVGGLLPVVWPERAWAFVHQKGWLPALALMMMFVAVLLAFALVQSAFSVGAFVALANLVSGIVCAVSKAATYVPLIAQASRAEFVGAVLIAHCIVYLLSEVLTITYSTLMLMIVFILPVVMIALVRWGLLATALPLRPIAPLGRCSGARALVAIGCAALVVVLCDYVASSRGWIVSLDALPSSVSPLTAVVTMAVGCVLVIGTARLSRRLTVSGCYQLFFALALISVMGGAGERPFFAVPSIYPHVMFWLLVYDVSRGGMIAPMRAFGAHIVVLHALDLLWVLFEGAHAAAPLMAVFYAVALCLVAASPLRRLEPASTSASEPSTEACDISQCLADICARAAQQCDLSEREREVLYLLAQGRSRRVICSMLSLSEGTVRSHTTHVYAKLGVHSSNELIEKIYGDEWRA